MSSWQKQTERLVVRIWGGGGPQLAVISQSTLDAITVPPSGLLRTTLDDRSFCMVVLIVDRLRRSPCAWLACSLGCCGGACEERSILNFCIQSLPQLGDVLHYVFCPPSIRNLQGQPYSILIDFPCLLWKI